ncbi:hypothetical protein B0I35DRAFT_359949 [Stachybotrys elegans]|uniref:Short-chain dehydrogenase/reductase 3 n=1 Tax=Stachybotrys elegans TaxID=80388 RepID=A0A8K0SIC7_9HYPO|nr:hypothetical protein B0I35DRAFT_359949 [Stachybotrys elegans]
MANYLGSAAQFALDHLNQRQLHYSLLLSALGLGYGSSWLNQSWSDEALNHGTTADFDWDKEIVLVTGGAGGIGGEIVLRMAQSGTRVVVLDVMELTYIPSSNIYYYQCDITDHEALKRVAQRIRAEVGEPTVVVANAGICRGKALLEETEHDVELTIGVNTLGLLWTVKTFLPSMVERNHGHVLIVASVTGYMGTARSVDYCASKAAAISIYEGLHTEMKHVYKSPAVRISCASPSLVQTKMFKGIKPVAGMVGSGMRPSFVAGKIADVLYSGKAQNLILSRWALPPGIMRVLPQWMRVHVQDRAASSLESLDPHNPMASKL